jgi:hypothetical protein
METIVSSGIKKPEGKPGNGNRLLQPKIELVGIPGNRDIKVRHANGYVIDLQGSKWAGGMGCS